MTHSTNDVIGFDEEQVGGTGNTVDSKLSLSIREEEFSSAKSMSGALSEIIEGASCIFLSFL